LGGRKLNLRLGGQVEDGKSGQILPIRIWVKALPWRAASGCAIEWLPESSDCWKGKMGVKFEWDRRKAALNLREHGVSFAEGSGIHSKPNHVFCRGKLQPVQRIEHFAARVMPTYRCA
jgi:hypothetical protein